MSTNEVKIKCVTEGFEEATEQIEAMADAYNDFPSQVTIRGCRDCRIQIYPSQTKIIKAKESEDK